MHTLQALVGPFTPGILDKTLAYAPATDTVWKLRYVLNVRLNVSSDQLLSNRTGNKQLLAEKCASNDTVSIII